MMINTTDELNKLISSEKEHMPSVTSYSSAFHFLASIQKRLEEQGIETKNISPAPLSTMTPAFIRLDKKGLQQLMCRFPNNNTPEEQKVSMML